MVDGKRFDAEGVSPEPHKLSHRVALKALARYASNASGQASPRTPSIDDNRALVEVLDEYQAEVEKRLAALEAKRG